MLEIRLILNKWYVKYLNIFWCTYVQEYKKEVEELIRNETIILQTLGESFIQFVSPDGIMDYDLFSRASYRCRNFIFLRWAKASCSRSSGQVDSIFLFVGLDRYTFFNIYFSPDRIIITLF